MYKALVRSHFDYCDIIYHIPPKINPPPQFPTFNSLMEKLERVQYLAALVVTGAWQGSNCSKLNEELGWKPFLTVVCVDAFYKFIKLCIRLLFILRQKPNRFYLMSFAIKNAELIDI